MKQVTIGISLKLASHFNLHLNDQEQSISPQFLMFFSLKSMIKLPKTLKEKNHVLIICELSVFEREAYRAVDITPCKYFRRLDDDDPRD